MEKILINSVENKNTKTGTPFKAVTFNHNQKATVWDMNIGEYMKNNIGNYIMAKVETSGKFKNIREIEMTMTTPSTENKPMALDMNDTDMPVVPQETKGSEQVKEVLTQAANRNNSIIAQVFVKKAVDMYNHSESTGLTKEEQLCENIQEIKKAYDFAFKLLQLDNE